MVWLSRRACHIRVDQKMDSIVDVFIADDHAMFRAGLSALLATLGDVRIVGECATGAEAIEAVTDAQPDVVLMDIHMPGMNGIEATREILLRSPHIRVVMLTMYEDDDSVFAALRAGALGYVLKGAKQDELARAVRAAAHGEALYSPVIARRILEYFTTGSLANPPGGMLRLSMREREILALMAQGQDNRDIAASLFLSDKTVRNHISNIYSKLHVSDRAQAIARALAAGIR